MSDVQLWSVTTLLKLGLGTSDALVNWAVNTTAEYAVDNQAAWAPLAQADRDAAVKVLKDARFARSGEAAARGTDVHKAAEAIALGQEVEVEDHILPYVDQYRRFLDLYQPEFLMAEAPVYAPKNHYAGTLDSILKIDGSTLVADIKTTPKSPDAKSRPPYPETAIQLCCYRRAELVGLLAERREVNYRRYYIYNPDNHHEPMLETDGAVCIVVSPHDFRVIPMRTDDEVWTAFLHIRENARWVVDISKRVIGPEISPVVLT